MNRIHPEQKMKSENNIIEITSDQTLHVEVLQRSTRHYSPGLLGIKERIWRKKVLNKRVPCTQWLPQYSSTDAVGDAIAGVSMGLMLIPQMLAFASLAGLDAQYGLYSAFLGMMMYVFVGSSPHVILSPTATSSLMVFIAANGSWQRSVLLTFLTGIVQLLAAVLRLGFIIDFISNPVGAGFTSALAFTIVASQLKSILGVKATGSTFVVIMKSLAENIKDTKRGDVILGVCCIVFLMFFRWLGRLSVGPEKDSEKSAKDKFFNKLFWILGLTRNANIVLITGLISFFMYQEDKYYFAINGPIPQGLPPFSLPPFHIPEIRNETTGEVIQEYESFWDIINYIGASIVVVPLVGLLENSNAVKTFAKSKPVDATQELIALGLGNIMNSFVSGYNSCGGLTKGSVVNSSGVRTQLASLYSALLVILALLFLAPGIFYIPKATLGAIVISAIVFVIKYDAILPMWRTKRTELIPAFATFFACLIFRIDIGILIGIGVNVIFILHHAARPQIFLEYRVTEYSTRYLMLTPDRCLYFPSVDYVKSLINKECRKSNTPVVLNGMHVFGADYTAVTTIKTMVTEFNTRSQPLFFINLNPGVKDMLESAKVGFRDFETIASLEAVIDEVGLKRTSL